MKRKLLVAAGIVVVLAGAAVLAVALLVKPEALKNQALDRIRAATDYRVEAGPAAIHFGWHGAGLRVHDILLAAPDSSQSLTVDELDVFLKLWPLLGKRVELSQVVLRRPVYTLAPREGATSPAGGEQAPPSLAFLAVESWQVEDGAFVQRGPWGNLRLDALDLAGGFVWRGRDGGHGDLHGRAGGGSFAGAQGAWPLPGAEASLAFRVAGGMDSLTVPSLDLVSGPVHAALHGGYARGASGWSGRLTGTVAPMQWAALQRWLPDTLTAGLHGMAVEGTLGLPELTVETAGTTRTSGILALSGVAVRAPQAPLGLTGFSGRVRFEPGRIALESAEGKVGDDTVRLSGQVEGGMQGTFTATVDTRLSAANLARLLPAGAPLGLQSGQTTVDVTASGTLPLAGLPDLSGTVGLSDLQGTFGDLPLRSGNGRVRFHGRGATVETLGAELGRSDFQVHGEIENLAEPWFRFDLTSRRLDLNQLMPEEKPGSGNAAAAEPPPAVGLPGEGTVSIAELEIRKLSVQDARAKVHLDLDGVVLSDMKGQAYGGAVTGNLAFRPAGEAGRWRYDGELHLAGVGTGPLLTAWTGLGNLLQGGVSGTLKLAGEAGRGIDPRSLLDLDGDLSMRDGALKNLPSLAQIGHTFGVSQLTGPLWPFRGMDLRFQVKHGVVQVQGLSFNQPGLAWSLGGSVGLDGKLGLKGVIRADPKKVKWPAGIDRVAADLTESDGRVPIPFTLGGTLADPVPHPDMQALEQQAAEKALQKKLKALPDTTAKKIMDFLKKPGNEQEKSLPDTAIKKLKNILGKRGGG